jgi:hypothetical protein
VISVKVAVIGTGSVGAALAEGFGDGGHEVVVGSRTPDAADARELVAALGDGASAVTDERAAEEGEVVVLAVPGSAVVDLAADLAPSLAGKPVLDPTNEVPRSGDRSLAERVQAAAPDARVVKAFNQIGANRMTRPAFDGDAATMLVCGDDSAATRCAADLAADLGFDPVEAGDLAAAGMLEDLARLWIHLSREYGRDIGFRLLRE